MSPTDEPGGRDRGLPVPRSPAIVDHGPDPLPDATRAATLLNAKSDWRLHQQEGGAADGDRARARDGDERGGRRVVADETENRRRTRKVPTVPTTGLIATVGCRALRPRARHPTTSGRR